MAKLSKEYVSDSDSETEAVPEFKVPNDYKKCKHLKKFNIDIKKKSKDQEVWLINVPAAMDISKLKTLPVNFKGTSSVNIDDESYEIEQSINNDNTNLSLLIPDETRESLTVCSKDNRPIQFDRIINISESKSIPNIQYDKVKVPRKDVQKVDGLIMRHFATGYDAKDFGVEETQIEKKRHADEDSESPSKKKKEKKEKKDKKKKKEKK